jgi:large subunit ribosomal protein L18
MQATIDRKTVRRRIRHRIRKRVSGSGSRPRVAVFRSGKHIYAQAIDDQSGRTIASVSTQDQALRGDAAKGWNQDAAKLVGHAMAERLKAAGIEQAVFDRGGYVYHGRIKALAEAIREAGLKM